jgi:hypothetical protein
MRFHAYYHQQFSHSHSHSFNLSLMLEGEAMKFTHGMYHQEGTDECYCMHNLYHQEWHWCYCMRESIPSGMHWRYHMQESVSSGRHWWVLLHAGVCTIRNGTGVTACSLHHQERHWHSSHEFQNFPYQHLILSLAITYNAFSILANWDNGAIL